MKNNERIDWLEHQIFYLAMKDHWSAEDYKQDRAWQKELRELKEQG
jgi:hypothetical protein